MKRILVILIISLVSVTLAPQIGDIRETAVVRNYDDLPYIEVKGVTGELTIYDEYRRYHIVTIIQKLTKEHTHKLYVEVYHYTKWNNFITAIDKSNWNKKITTTIDPVITTVLKDIVYPEDPLYREVFFVDIPKNYIYDDTFVPFMLLYASDGTSSSFGPTPEQRNDQRKIVLDILSKL